MLGKIFAVLVIASFACGMATGRIDAVCASVLSGATEAVSLSISLLGMMMLWNGVIRALDKAGFTRLLTKCIAPVLRLMYPAASRAGIPLDDVAADYSANLMGLGNAALPIGMRAINRLKESGLPKDGSANDDMILFAVLNTTPLQLMPTTLIALRTAAGSSNPFEIIGPIWITSIATTVFGVFVCKAMAKLYRPNAKRARTIKTTFF